MTTCEVCGRVEKSSRHPCRFEKACACWYGVACEPAGAPYRTGKRSAVNGSTGIPRRKRIA